MAAGRDADAVPRTLSVPFTSRTSCVLRAPEQPAAGRRPPLLVGLHGQGQSGARHLHWMRGALPPHVAAAFPDGFHKHEVRAAGRPIRIAHAWYMFTGDQDAFVQSLLEAEAALWPLVDAATEALGSDPGRVYLAGFSQGAYLTHCAAVRAPGRVAGWIAQSGRLKTELLEALLPGVAGKPVLIQHGRNDPNLPPHAAEDSAAALSAHGADVTLRFYDGGHAITPAMVADARAWLFEREPA
jgi:phospholipase/carboxylesterase